jgi:hypothetical protein
MSMPDPVDRVFRKPAVERRHAPPSDWPLFLLAAFVVVLLALSLRFLPDRAGNSAPPAQAGLTPPRDGQVQAVAPGEAGQADAVASMGER